MFKIDHISISVKNLEKSLEFYKLFGFEVFNKYISDIVDIYAKKQSMRLYRIMF